MPSIVPFTSDKVMGSLHQPFKAENTTTQSEGLVLTHGAGANSQAPLLVALASVFASSGYHVLRCDLPFRQQRRFGPPHPSRSAEDREGLRAALTALRQLVSGPIFLGGHSYGGRQASMLAAEDPSISDGLLLLSYPLHPPNKPDQLRTVHFERLHTPAFFVHGTRDPFGSREEMLLATKLIPAVTELMTIEGAGHDLRRGKTDVSAEIKVRFESARLRWN